MIMSLLAAALMPAAPVPLPAISKWNIDYGETNCMLGRKFTDGKSVVVASFRSPPLSGSTDIVVAWRSSDESLKYGGATVTVNGVTLDRASFTAFASKQPGQRMLRVTIGSTFVAGPGDKLLLTIQPDKEPGWAFAIPSVGAGFAALDQCNAALLKEWGIDPAERAKRVTTPAVRIDARKWLGGADYPDEALLSGAQGSTMALLTVQPNGRVGACRVVVSSGSPALDQHTCRTLTLRARYTPARDAAGRRWTGTMCTASTGLSPILSVAPLRSMSAS